MEGILRSNQYIFVVLHGRDTAVKSVQLCCPSWRAYCGQVSTILLPFMEGILQTSQYNFVVLHGRDTVAKSVQLCGNFLLTTLETGINVGMSDPNPTLNRHTDPVGIIGCRPYPQLYLSMLESSISNGSTGRTL